MEIDNTVGECSKSTVIKEEVQLKIEDKSAESAESDDDFDFEEIIEEPHIPSIVDSISQEQIDNFQPVHIRYFQDKFCTLFTSNNVNLDTCIRVHTNKLCLVFLSPKHSLVVGNQQIKKINFQVSKKVNRYNNAIKGKGKKGAQFLQPESLLCFVETVDGDSYPVKAGVHGKLLEINANIPQNYNLIKDDLNEGFIAVILPDKNRFDQDMSKLINKDDYFKK